MGRLSCSNDLQKQTLSLCCLHYHRPRRTERVSKHPQQQLPAKCAVKKPPSSDFLTNDVVPLPQLFLGPSTNELVCGTQLTAGLRENIGNSRVDQSLYCALVKFFRQMRKLSNLYIKVSNRQEKFWDARLEINSLKSSE